MEDDFAAIFERIRALFERHAAKCVTLCDEPSRYYLGSHEVRAKDGYRTAFGGVEVKKNYTIAELANSLFDMTGLARFGNYTKAQNVLDTSVAIAYRRYPNMEDEDIRFILNIVEGYRRDLTAYNGHYRRSDCGNCR